MKIKISSYLGIALGVAYDKRFNEIIIMFPILFISIRKK